MNINSYNFIMFIVICEHIHDFVSSKIEKQIFCDHSVTEQIPILLFLQFKILGSEANEKTDVKIRSSTLSVKFYKIKVIVIFSNVRFTELSKNMISIK